MVRPSDLVVWLKDVDREDIVYVGDKGANLGEMAQAGFPVPPGFVLTTHAFTQFIKINKLERPISHLLNTINFNDPNSLRAVSSHIKKLIIDAPISEEISHLVFNHYEKLDVNTTPRVAVRSSAIPAQARDVMYSGLQETFLNIQGESALLHKIREVWAGLFDAQAIQYRYERKNDHLQTKTALVIQKMVNSDVSGVLFTIDPVANNKNAIIVEAIYGLGEYLEEGKLTPDHYEINKRENLITNKHVVFQEIMLTQSAQGNKEIKVPAELRGKQKIADKDILAVADIARKLEKHYYFPQDAEWAIENGKIYLVQTKQITNIAQTKKEDKKTLTLSTTTQNKPLLIGDPASPGVAFGQVKIVKNAKEIHKVMRGDVLVAENTDAEYLPALRKAAAVIVERGGRNTHAGVIARQFGIPAVIGVPHVMQILKEGMVVTVYGKTGTVVRGSTVAQTQYPIQPQEHPKTKTKVMVSLSDPYSAAKVAGMNVDGVGLLRAEQMFAEVGVHPKKLIHERKGDAITKILAEGISEVCKAFYPRPVMYRLSDLTAREYSQLIGGKEYELHENNPLIGYRGALRHLSDGRVFELEIEAIKRVREKMKYNNLSIMLPFVRTVSELEQLKKRISQLGLRRSHTFKISMMCEVPSNVVLIDEFLRAGIDGVSIGTNDLMMLMLGVDKENEEIGSLFDERDASVAWALERVITACKKKDVPVSISGYAPSNFPDLVQQAVSWGVTSLSVTPDAVDTSREFVYKAERGNE